MSPSRSKKKYISITLTILLVLTVITAFSACSANSILSPVPDQSRAVRSYVPSRGMLGEATNDENYNVHGGQPGDQNGGEVATAEWEYSDKEGHFRHWEYVIRAVDPQKSLLAAEFVEGICRNNAIGYNNYTQDTIELRNSLYLAAKEVDFDSTRIIQPVDVSCTPLVLTGLSAAGIEMDAPIRCEYQGEMGTYLYRTVNAESLLDVVEKINADYEKRGEQAPLMVLRSPEYTQSPKQLMRGDILCSGHHTSMAL